MTWPAADPTKRGFFALPRDAESTDEHTEEPSPSTKLDAHDVPPPELTPPVVPTDTTKIVFLDGLRGLAAMLVVSHHSKYFRDNNLGADAVDTFFVLSAFLLTMIFEKRGAPPRQAARVVRDVGAHAGRLLRASLSTRLPTLRAHRLRARAASSGAQDPLLRCGAEHVQSVEGLAFKHGYRYYVFWTLPIELKYYLVIPPLAATVVYLKRYWWLLVVLPAYGVVFYNGLYVRRVDHHPFWIHVPTLLCGSLAAFVFSKLDYHRVKRGFVFERRHRVAVRAFQAAALLLLASTSFRGLIFDWVMANPLPQAEGSVRFISFYVTVLIVSEMLLPGPISLVLEWPVLVYAGHISFSVYLLHVYVVRAPFVEHDKPYNKFFATWLLVVALSAASHRLVEQPCQRLAASIGKRILAKGVSNAVAA